MASNCRQMASIKRSKLWLSLTRKLKCTRTATTAQESIALCGSKAQKSQLVLKISTLQRSKGAQEAQEVDVVGKIRKRGASKLKMQTR